MIVLPAASRAMLKFCSCVFVHRGLFTQILAHFLGYIHQMPIKVLPSTQNLLPALTQHWFYTVLWIALSLSITQKDA